MKATPHTCLVWPCSPVGGLGTGERCHPSSILVSAECLLFIDDFFWDLELSSCVTADCAFNTCRLKIVRIAGNDL